MDKFVKLRKIGEGSFGKAFLVKSKTNGEQYVVKEIGILKMNVREREESRKEVAVLAQLNHPNIVTYRESFEEHGSLFIVMDYCAGGDLYSKISSQRGVLFQENQVLDWFVQICLALKHIHDRKILHRDIKSQNIFLTTSGRVRLGDFGIAKVLNSTVELARTCIGTPYYLSPEICENKPYNNKSDVWSLGCVLYEMATLKHAFESGNMKNLVLKIIRGSYPPISPKYSYELRALLAQLFKRSPRDRPSINSVLKKQFLRPRIQKFLSDSELSDEFSHTVMHGVKIKKKLDPGDAVRPPVVPSRPPSAGRGRPPAVAGRYDPSKVYGQPVARRSKENRVSVDVKKRPGSAENRRPPPLGPSASLEKRRQELIAREKKRQEEARNKQHFEKRHQELVEKQRMARMNKAREEGWQNIISMGSGDGDKNVNRDKPKADVGKAKLNWPASQENREGGDQKGRYDHYNAYLDKLERDRQERAPAVTPQPRAYMAAGPAPSPRVGLAWGPNPAPALPNPAELAVRQAQENRMKAEEAAERAKLVGDYLQRKKAAAVNKARGQAELYGRGPSSANQQRRGSGGARPNVNHISARNKEEQEYLENLRKIRLQNFNERRKLQENLCKNRPDVSHEERKNKIKALRLQADQRAHELKVNLEREAFERKMKLMENQRQIATPGPDVRMKNATPAPAVAMTKVLQEIGVAPQSVQIQPTAEEIAKEKQAEAIRKNLAENPPEASRNRWVTDGEPVAVPDSARSQWAEEHQTLSMLPLEQTSSQQSQESGSGPEDSSQPEPVSARRQWGGKAGTVLHALQERQIASATVTLPDDNPCNRPQIGITQGSDSLFDKVMLFDDDGELVQGGNKKRIPLTGVTVTLHSNQSAEESKTDLSAAESKTNESAAVSKTNQSAAESNTNQSAAENKTNQSAAESKTQKSGLIKGLTTGCFDVDNAQVLRTCSEPDLAKLFKSLQKENSFVQCASAKPSKSLEFHHDDNEDHGDDDEDHGDDDVKEEDDISDIGNEDSAVQNVNSSETDNKASETVDDKAEVEEEGEAEAGDKSEAEVGVKSEAEATADIDSTEEEQVTVDDEEDEDVLTVRQSMASLLTLEPDGDDDDDSIKVAFSLTDTDDTEVLRTVKSEDAVEMTEKSEDICSAENEEGENVDKKYSDKTANNDDQTSDAGDTERPEKIDVDGDGEGEGDIDDDIEIEDEDGSLEEEADIEDEARPHPLPVTFSELFESDESNEDDDDIDDEYDVFSNLEESRMELEQDLGCDKFLQAYKAVQAVHEDEDEDIEAGTKIALGILGSNHEHLYPKIFQLVMADTAFTEDNM